MDFTKLNEAIFAFGAIEWSHFYTVYCIEVVGKLNVHIIDCVVKAKLILKQVKKSSMEIFWKWLAVN